MIRRRCGVLRVIPQLLYLVRGGDLLDELLGRPGGRCGLDRHRAHRGQALVPDGVAEAGSRPESSAAIPVERHHAWRLKQTSAPPSVLKKLAAARAVALISMLIRPSRGYCSLPSNK